MSKIQNWSTKRLATALGVPFLILLGFALKDSYPDGQLGLWSQVSHIPKPQPSAGQLSSSRAPFDSLSIGRRIAGRM